MTPEHSAALAAELQNDIYNGLTVEQAYALLHEPQAVVEYGHGQTRRRSAISLLNERGKMGGIAYAAAQGNVYAAQTMMFFSHPDYQTIDFANFDAVALMDGLIASNLIDNDDKADIIALSVIEYVTVTDARILSAFTGVPGMPNSIDEADFNEVWGELYGA